MIQSPFDKDGKIRFSSSLPYPPLEVEEPNAQYARMLGNDLASAKSEMTSICQYLYHSWTLPKSVDDIPTIMRRIAEVEMHHFDMLGQLIVKLGGNPRYMSINKRPQFWQGRMVVCSRTPAMALKDDMVLEQSTIAVYRGQVSAIRDHHIVAVLRRILIDEEIHLAIFRYLFSQINAGGKGGKERGSAGKEEETGMGINIV